MERAEVTVVDAGTGNLASVINALRSQGVPVRVSGDREEVAAADRLILPGVGAFARFMAGLRERDLLEVLRNKARSGTPFLGICVGMQAMFTESSEMGRHAGLGLLAGDVRPFLPASALKIPHTGWNEVHYEREGALFRGMAQDFHAYFNHSYFVSPADEEVIAAVTAYPEPFASAVQRGRMYGVQFHPEKSQEAGLRILRNFIQYG